VVSLNAGHQADTAVLQAHVRGRIAGYKVPRDIAFATAVPRAENGKANYPEAKRLVLESIAAGQR
jgi:fatty-acyl-CoA synthase